ncbi:hypothetical protein CAQUA_03630 [Corynebacterium aquatimens]|nr:hypothetical protein CAQUA_03630 [Corynebacterium aquatimens]
MQVVVCLVVWVLVVWALAVVQALVWVLVESVCRQVGLVFRRRVLVPVLVLVDLRHWVDLADLVGPVARVLVVPDDRVALVA